MTKSVSLPKVQAKWTNPDGTPTREIYRWASNKDNNEQEIYATVVQLVDTVNAFNNAPGGLDQYNLAQLALKAGLADPNVFTGTNTFTKSLKFLGWASDLSTTSPNDAVFNAVLQATGTATDIDATIEPQGAGAFTLNVADGTATGGNKRGKHAIDVQSYRADAANVASGDYSSTVGVDNKASGLHSCGMGFANIATGEKGAAIGNVNFAYGERSSAVGNSNTASGLNANAVGRGNSASGDSANAFGNTNTASGSHSNAIGASNHATGDRSTAVGYHNTSSGYQSSVFGHHLQDHGYANVTMVGHNDDATVADQFRIACGNGVFISPVDTSTFTGSELGVIAVDSVLQVPVYYDPVTASMQPIGIGGSVSLAAVGSSPNADAATLTGSVLNLEPADGSNPGVVTTSAQTFAGVKTFTDPPIVPDAVNPTDAVNLATLQSYLANLDSRTEVAYTSTSALAANTYSNGSSGVGATLTGNSNGPLVIDGITAITGYVGMRVLIAGESNAAHNGIYIITQAGVVAVSPYILTRATDFDQAAEIGPGIVIPTRAPSALTPGTNDGTVYLSIAPVPFTVGTDSLTFSPVGTATTGITALTGDVLASGTGSVAATIANSAVTLANQADVATGTVFYRKTAGTGAPEVQTLATLKTDLAYTKSDIGLGSVTNDAQTEAAIVPNTAPVAGQILVGNAGGTAYAPVTMSGGATMTSAGVVTLATGNTITVVKATDTARTNNTVADDPDLQIPLAVGTWQINVRVFTSCASATPKFRCTLAFSGTATGNAKVILISPATTAFIVTAPGAFSSGGLITPGTWAAGTGYVEFTLALKVTVAGTLSFQWAQTTTNASTTTVTAGSAMTAIPA